jgi:hypothetical protein
MKKLIFNGCSFVAGEAIVWDQFCAEQNVENFGFPFDYNKYPPKHGERLSNLYHWFYKKNYNLSAQCGKYLDTDVIDLSMDGNSNTSIALTTIDFLQSLPRDNLDDYHVIIGWTEYSRVYKYFSGKNDERFIDVSTWYLNNSPNIDVREFCKFFYSTWKDYDFLLDYMKNILLLESFLKSNNISYTFFRSLGDEINDSLIPEVSNFMKEYHTDVQNLTNHETFNNYPENRIAVFKLNMRHRWKISHHRSFINSDHWYAFGKDNGGWLGKSWRTHMYETQGEFLSKQDHHPSLNAVKLFAKDLCNQIIQDIS